MKNTVKTISMLSIFYYRQIWKELPFIIILASGLCLQVAYILIAKGNFEANVLPSTYEVLDVIRGFQPALLVLMALYSGELYHKEKIVKISPLMDVLPYHNGTRLISQVWAMMGILITVLFLLALTGIATQLASGFYDIKPGLYLITLFTETLFNGAFIIILAYFFHIVVNHKFLGHALVVLLIIAQSYLPAWGLEHKMYQYAAMSLGQYSDLIGYQSNQVMAFVYYAIYWLGLSLVLFQLSKTLIIRGIESGYTVRFRLFRNRFQGKVILYSLSGSILFIASGANIYINTNLINDFQTRADVEQYKYEYERQLKQFETIALPEIIGTSLEADLYPSKNTYRLKGQFLMINPQVEPISQVHIQEDFDENINMLSLSFDRSFIKADSFPEFRYSIYHMDKPLAKGDTLTLNFEMEYKPAGFSQARDQYLPQTASFFTQEHFPSLGYQSDFELTATPLRQKFDLKAKDRLPEMDDQRAYTIGLNSANNIDYEAIISTEKGYHATTSGRLIREWSENGRSYFHFKSHKPMENQYAIITGKLTSQTEYVANGLDSISLSLFYYPEHDYNLKHIQHAMRASFNSFQAAFSPYQYDRMAITEVPRLHDFAMSLPNTIAFSESMGFMTKPNVDGLSLPFYITAHEVAHQWWGDQVRGAAVKGEDMITETLAQYAAGMVTLQEFGEESLEHLLDYERGRYLRGRKREVQQEQPLAKAEKQTYIHYGKGLINMMALRHYISEDSVNAALRRVIEKFPASEAIYPNTLDVISEFRNSTPDSLQYLVTDLFERIIFLENRIQDASFKTNSAGNFILTADLITKKYESDKTGLLQPININDWIEVVIYGLDQNGDEIIIHQRMCKFDNDKTQLTLNLKTAPTRMAIDPMGTLMDRNFEDNEWRF